MTESQEYVKNNPGKTPEEYFEAGFDSLKMEIESLEGLIEAKEYYIKTLNDCLKVMTDECRRLTQNFNVLMHIPPAISLRHKRRNQG